MPYSFDEALAFLIDNKLTKQQYTNILELPDFKIAKSEHHIE
jgi:hypothetical protein